MKNLILSIIITWFLSPNTGHGQFNTGGIFGDRWAQTNNPPALNNDVRRGGMGDFTGFASAPIAAFHINANFLTSVNPHGN